MSFGGVNQTGATGAPIFGNQGPAAAPVAAGAVQGQAGAPANGATPFFNTSIESVMAAVSRGEIPLNLRVQAGNQFGGVASEAVGPAGNPTLLQAISQGLPQNGTNGLNGVAAGGGTVNASYASFNTAPGTFDAGFDSTATIDPKQMANATGQTFTNQYGGN